MTATAFGMAPSALLRHILRKVMQRYPWLLYPLIGFCVIYLVVFFSSSFVCGKSIHQINQDISKIRDPNNAIVVSDVIHN